MAPSKAFLCLLSLALSLSYSYVLPPLPQTSGSCMFHLLSEREKALNEGGPIPEDGRFACISGFSAKTLRGGRWSFPFRMEPASCGTLHQVSLEWPQSLHLSVAPGIL